MPENAAELAAEGRMFARYLVGQRPPDEVVARYVDASRTLFPAPAAADLAIGDFARRPPRSVGFPDAAAGFLRPGSLLRSKGLVMAAILEASPEHADDFLPRPVHPLRLGLELAWHGTVAGARVLVGAVVWTAAARSRA
jgi:hypothetical protein